MSEQLDNELRNRINEVFEHYEDTTPAQEGWLLLREKFPAKKKRPVIAIWWSAAAVLLLFSIFGTWMYTQQQKNNILAVKPSQPINPKNNVQLDSIVVDHYENGINKTTTFSKEQYADRGGKTITKHLTPSEKIPDAFVYPDIVKSPQQLAANTAPKADVLLIKQLPKSTIGIADSSRQGGNSKIVQQSVLALQAAKVQQSTNVVIKTDSAKINGESKMSIYLANEQKIEAAKKQKSDTKLAADKKVLYSVYAATYFNYAEGSKSQINTGAGFSTDIKLAGNFKLSTGIAIGRNTLNYKSQPTQASIAMDAMRAASGSGSANGAVQSSPATASFGFSSLKVLASPVVSAYNISLTGLDLPVNIKYEFNPKKSDSYISAGLSSGTFISETYNYSYDNSVNALGASPAIPDASVSRSFTRFDFARTLNISLGMGYQLTKSNRLIIEPFVKYPLSGMGSQDIRFGSGGINLRLKFQGSGKKK
jgi:hypothetical protein